METKGCIPAGVDLCTSPTSLHKLCYSMLCVGVVFLGDSCIIVFSGMCVLLSWLQPMLALT